MTDRLLLVEDDVEAARQLQPVLESAGHQVTHCADAESALARAEREDFDVLIVDRMLPGMDGLSLIEALRRQNKTMPVLVLSALGTVDDRVQGLRSGSDDYLTKPFAVSELLARIDALLRRRQPSAETTLRVADVELDLLKRSARRGEKSLDLTARELRLLEFLMRHAGQIVTRSMLLESVWDLHFDPQTNVTDVHISRLRQAVDKGFSKPLIHTVRGAGYTMRDE